MRKCVFTFLVALVMSAGVAMAAQQHPRRGMGMNIDQQVAKMKSTYNLNDQQTSQVKSLFEKQQDEMKTWRQNNPQATREDMRTQHDKFMQEREDGLKTIMTADQFKQYQADMQKRREMMKHGPKKPSQK
jgi:ABC-type uncharacterized transport system substrate-binding protein